MMDILSDKKNEDYSESKTVIEMMSDGITVSDEEGRFYIFNAKMREITGYTIEEANQQIDFNSLIYPEAKAHEEALEGIAEMIAGKGHFEVERTICTKDNSKKTVIVSTAQIVYKDRVMFLSVWRDITERREIENLLRDSEISYRRLFETAKDGILILDAETGSVIDSNPFIQNLVGYTHHELIGKKLWEVGFFKDEESSKKAFLELQTNKYIRYEDLPLKAKNGQSMDVEFISNVYSAGIEKVIQCNIRDVSIRKKTETDLRNASLALKQLVTVDDLTGLNNRRGLSDFLTHMMPRFMGFLMHSHALLIDLDNFKTINESFGYVVGDIALKETAKKIKGAVRSTDYVARVGGDEFIVLLLGARFAEASKVAEKIRREISKAVIGISGNRTINTSASIGLVNLNKGPVTIDELFENAQHALSESKRLGKNLVSYDNGQTISRIQDSSIADVVNQLCTGDGLEVVTQPIVDIRNGTPVAYEMLSRFHHLDFGSPEVFFQMAINAKVLTLVDHACLKKCLALLDKLPDEMTVHLNLFPSTIVNITAELLLDELNTARKQRKICVEISEQQFIGDPTYLIEAAHLFKQAGISVAIDDAGFGGSCLESIILLEPDIIKIDKSCIRGIHQNCSRVNSLKRMLGIISSCHATPIAEGIETAEELQALLNLDIQYGQGYYFARPSKDLPA